MDKVIVRKISAKKGNPRQKAVAKTHIRNSAGKLIQFFTIDAGSPTFKDDLTYVYQANVATAREENKKLFGSADGQPKRGKLLVSTGNPHGRRKK
jgi:hypothetical protein